MQILAYAVYVILSKFIAFITRTLGSFSVTVVFTVRGTRC